ncbi:MAG: PDZ domain-containing protein [Burkholderiaceae bacterium]|nr:PDZ domain-containing protein [Burkholderiaceae bacterium]
MAYRIQATDPHAHLFEVELELDEPDPEGQRFTLPVWIPGSYMVREFARNIVGIEARSAGRKVALTKLDKNTWLAARCTRALRLRYTVYAWDLSVRGAHLDASHGFFNGTSVFLCVSGQEDRACRVDIVRPRGKSYRDWQVATTLERAGAKPWGFGTYSARDYDELIDHPVEMGRFTKVEFELRGVPHAIVLTGQHDADPERLAADLHRVCDAQIRLFEPRTRKAPFDRYLFLTTVVGDGYGGLEHRASTALVCARDDLPYPAMQRMSDGYRKFLGLASHEYFHSWLVKRIKPQAFTPYAFDRENYTRLLWIFEGFTSYYDDLMLVRSGAISVEDYLKLLGSTASQVLRGAGRLRQSVAESSFDAWIKYYRQDENSPNAIVSYYAKGALVALCIDQAIRERSAGKSSLDDVLRLMWRRHGRDDAPRPQGLPEDGFAALVRDASGVSLDREIADWAYGTSELPLAKALSRVAIEFDTRSAGPVESMLGMRVTARHGELVVASVQSGGAAQRAGVSAGDAIVALDGLRADEKALRARLERRREGERARLHVFRRDELLAFDVRLGGHSATDATMKAMEKPGAAARKARDRWLG